MAKTPRRTGFEGARTLSEIVALNVRSYRAARRLKQSELAEHMVSLGHGWAQATVSEVERNERNVTVEELGGLAVIDRRMAHISAVLGLPIR